MSNAKHVTAALLLLASMSVYAAPGEGPMTGKWSKHMARLDANGDGAVSAEEMAQHRQKMFAEIDSDGDGFITTEENEAFKEKMRKQRGLFARADSDGDGRVSAAEFSAQADKMVSRMDRNGDGSIGPEEMRPRHLRDDREGKGDK